MSQTRKILIVEDDVIMSETLQEQLALHEEFEILTAETAKQGLDCARTMAPDLVLMDVGLPDQDGRETCKLMRKAGLQAPVIMLTGADSDADTILGLEAGANDYVTKPFRFGVLLARMRAQLRQHEQTEAANFTIAQYRFLPAQKVLLGAQDKKIRLTEKETNILKYLLRAEAEVVHRDTLLEEVWGYNSGVTTHTLETHIYRLRQKIEADPSKAEILVTDAGGYRLNAASTDEA
ncbi:MAG: response regulator transcription factor [Parvibaculales bacterium]